MRRCEDVNDVLKKGFRPKGYHVAPWFWNEDGKIVYIYRLNNIYNTTCTCEDSTVPLNIAIAMVPGLS